MRRCVSRAWLGALGLLVPSAAWAGPPALPAGDPAPTDAAAEPAPAPAPADGAPTADAPPDAAPTDAAPTDAAPTDAPPTEVDAEVAGPDIDVDPAAETPASEGSDDSERATQDPGMAEGRREGLMPTNYGSIGLFHTTLPDTGGKYTFRFRVHTDFFRTTNLMARAGDQHARVRGAITLGFSPFKWGELFFSIKSSANRNQRDQPDREDAEAVFALGDIDFGVKGAHRFKNGIGVGGAAAVGLLSGSDRLRTSNVNFSIDGLFAVDLRYLTKKKVPVRLSANIGWILDNSLLVANFGGIRDDVSREVSRFSLGGNHSRVRMRYALDFPIRLGKRRQFGIDPILEWAWDVSTREEPAFKQRNSTPSPLPRSSQWLTLGMRANVISGLHLDAAADIALVKPSFEFGPTLPPWQIILGLGWSFDPKPVIREVEVESKTPPPPAPAPVEGRILGTVLDVTGQPVPDAKVSFPGAASNAIVADAAGAFTSFRFPAGTIAVQVEVGGQVVAEASAEVKNGEDTQLQIQLQNPLVPPTGLVYGAITDAAGGPIDFTMHVVGPDVDDKFTSASPGQIAIELVAGDYRATLSAPGFRNKDISFTVQAKGELTLKEQLERDAPVATPNVSGGKSSIKLKKRIRYEGNAVASSSFGLLDELAAFLNSHPEYQLVEVGVHTDDRGAAQQRSDERADSVKAYLVSKGVSDSRLSAKGFGASKPVAVNLTEQGRAKNNRTALTVKKRE